MKEQIQALRNNDGLTLRGYKSITYKRAIRSRIAASKLLLSKLLSQLLRATMGIVESGTVTESIMSIIASE